MTEPVVSSEAAVTLIRPISPIRWRYTKQRAPWVMALFLFGIFVDYGGGFNFKLALTVLALLWVLTRRVTPPIWAKAKWDILVMLVIPGLLGALHVIATPTIGYGQGFVDLYGTLSSPLLLFLLPLVYLTGVHRSRRMVLMGMILVASAMILVAGLHTAGIINLSDYSEWASTYRVGFIGIDPRQQGVLSNLRPLVSPRVGFTLVFGLGLALSISWLWSGLIAIALIILNARGMWFGALLAIGLWLVSKLLGGRFRFTRRGLLAVSIMIVVLATFFLATSVGSLLVNNVQAIIARFGEQMNAEDLSTQVRLGHLEGFGNLIADRPLGILVGFGPSASLYNSAVDELYSGTEISGLNIAMWYGVLYLILYLGWLFGAAGRLWMLRHRPGYTREDTALVIGAVSFWLAANTNPLLTSPITVIALMLIRVRILELAGYHPRMATKNG